MTDTWKNIVRQEEDPFKPAWDFSGLKLNDLIRMSKQMLLPEDMECFEAVKSEIHNRIKAGER